MLYEFLPNPLEHSIGHVLPRSPLQMRASRIGSTVAIVDDEMLAVYERRVWQTGRPHDLGSRLKVLIRDNAFDDIEKLHEIISSQSRNGFGMRSAELNHLVVRHIAVHWKSLEKSAPDSREYQHLESWRGRGSHLAVTAQVVCDTFLEQGTIALARWLT